jgi:predicted RNA-binding protein with PIN domain
VDAQLISSEINAIRGHHVKGGMGEVDDAGYAIDKGKTGGQKGVYTATDQTADNYIKYHIAYVNLSFRHSLPVKEWRELSKALVIVYTS